MYNVDLSKVNPYNLKNYPRETSKGLIFKISDQ